MAALAYHSATPPSDFEDMEPRESDALAREVIAIAQQDAETRMDAMKAQTEAITQTISDAAQGIMKSNKNMVEALARMMRG